MQTKKWMKTGMLALLWTTGALTFTRSGEAEIFTNGNIGAGCSQSCVDVWRVECKDNQTHQVRVRVRDNSGNDENIAVLNVGYFPAAVLNVFGQADLERSTGGAFSPPAQVTRAGVGAGVTRTLAQISVHSGASLSSAYETGFSCRDVNNGEVGNPTVTLIQNQ